MSRFPTKLIFLAGTTIIGVFFFANSAFATITSGNYTLKTSGGNYSTWAAFWNDLGDLTGDITLIVDASAFTETVAPAAVTENLNGHTLKVTAATFPSATDDSTGPRFTWNSADIFLDMEMEGPGTVIIDGIVFLQGTEIPPGVYKPYGIDTGFTFILRRNIIKGGSYGIYLYDGSPTYRIYNNIIYNQSGSYGMGIGLGEGFTGGFCSNNTIIDVMGTTAGYGLWGGDTQGLSDNNLVYKSKTADFFGVSAAVTGNNNSSYDATADDFKFGANNRINKTTSPFTSYAGKDFTLAVGSDPIGNGKNLSAYFTTDFFGTTRTNWSIGAVEGVGVSMGGTNTKTHICKTNAINAATQTCIGGSWCDTTIWSNTSPSSCPYNVQPADVATSPNNYCAFVCDESNVCSAPMCSAWSATALNTPPVVIVVDPAIPDPYPSASDAIMCSNPAYNFSWIFSDLDTSDTQSQYQLQVDKEGTFALFVAGEVDTIATSNALSKEVLLVKNAGINQLDYNTNYKGRVRVWDNNGGASDWVYGTNFTTPTHIYPSPYFDWSPKSIIKEQSIQFLSDASQCYNDSNNIISCSGANFIWTLIDSVIVGGTTANPIIKFNVSGNPFISLQITDNVGACSTSTNARVSLSLPKYKEILPQ